MLTLLPLAFSALDLASRALSPGRALKLCDIRFRGTFAPFDFCPVRGAPEVNDVVLPGLWLVVLDDTFALPLSRAEVSALPSSSLSSSPAVLLPTWVLVPSVAAALIVAAAVAPAEATVDPWEPLLMLRLPETVLVDATEALLARRCPDDENPLALLLFPRSMVSSPASCSVQTSSRTASQR